jgi:hypothetical protein
MQALIDLSPTGGCRSQNKILSNFAYDTLGDIVSASNIAAGLVSGQPGGMTEVQRRVGTLTTQGLEGLETLPASHPGLRAITAILTGIPRRTGLRGFQQEAFDSTDDVPEPAAMFLAGASLVALGLLHRRLHRG